VKGEAVPGQSQRRKILKEIKLFKAADAKHYMQQTLKVKV
jgi:hypothetical protein